MLTRLSLGMPVFLRFASNVESETKKCASKRRSGAAILLNDVANPSAAQAHVRKGFVVSRNVSARRDTQEIRNSWRAAKYF